MGATRDLFKAEFEERDNKIAELAKEVESKDRQLDSNKKLLESKDSIIEKLKAELARLGGNVATF